MGDYCLHGVRLRSPIPLGRASAHHQTPDLELSVGVAAPVPAEDVPEGAVVVELETDGRRLYTGTDAGSHYVLRVHGACDFLLDRELGAVECRPDPAAPLELVGLFVRGAFLAFYLGLLRACTLHAAAVEAPDGSAVVIVGGSGMGKSTLAALACLDGARFVSDDLVRLDGAEPPRWVGRSSEVRLRAAATKILPEIPASWHPRPTADGRLALRPPATRRRQGPLTAVVIPHPTKRSGELRLTRLDPVEAVIQVAAFPRLAEWRCRDVVEAQFDGVARVARSLPVFVAEVPAVSARTAGLGARLLRDVRERS